MYDSLEYPKLITQDYFPLKLFTQIHLGFQIQMVQSDLVNYSSTLYYSHLCESSTLLSCFVSIISCVFDFLLDKTI